MPLDGTEIWIDTPIDFGCRYILDGIGPCGAARALRSSYCLAHHAICYLSPAKAVTKAQEFDALAVRVGQILSFEEGRADAPTLRASKCPS